ncbi:hypothetical protein NP493_1502g00040 [Ridgeia piscesae]|uniref:Uncharacterized protein n=1 Tax=Ridgeia piscesae TaxID=27915 RepID=A0AAD9K0U1_RIDPI|nr:hypothetical protein NP493_1502g00040 [Ridgeia piscesae]
MSGCPPECNDLAAAGDCSPFSRHCDRDLLMASAAARLATHDMELQPRRTLAPLPSIISKDPSKLRTTPDGTSCVVGSGYK